MAVFDGPGSYYGTHPQNILRGNGLRRQELPYFKNIVDQYRAMVKYNRGYAYNMMFVGPGWMSKGGAGNRIMPSCFKVTRTAWLTMVNSKNRANCKT